MYIKFKCMISGPPHASIALIYGSNENFPFLINFHDKISFGLGKVFAGNLMGAYRVGRIVVCIRLIAI